ncbi:hypothetical protein EPR50_G00030770 [Perca flavescens]|uniref:Uncharacterized protein n=1 Tax=Perca flavescens TaxID=8167 RepID=A0A484DIS3_PERFV|nr:hypothetical protein EPR50_G00030770 [Perca flavescens]
MDVVRVLHRGFCDLWNTRLLETDEFRWLERCLELQAASKPPNQLVAWAEIRLKGSPNFTDLRTAVFAHAKNNLPAEQRTMVATLMCNNTATADCFYALSLNVAQSKRVREHFRQALTHPVPSPESPEASSSSTTRKSSCKPESSSSSKDETPVPYQESVTSGLE